MSRRQGRYERRMAKRQKRKEERADAVGSIEDVFAFHDLYKAGIQCCTGVRWKQSTQNFEAHLLSRTAVCREKLLSGTWKPMPYHRFALTERGKTRQIAAPHINDRQMEKVFAQKVLLPLYQPSMIYNNGASLPGKGFDFTCRQLKEDLRSHFRRYGREGWIVLLDFEHFFPGVPHSGLYKRHRDLILDPDLRRLADQIVDTVPGDKGLPLGVEPSQVEMIAYPSALDNYIKCQLSVHGMGHYMDDYYLLIPPDRDPRQVLETVIQRAESTLGLMVNRDKTRILSLTKSFKFCKAKYTLTASGRVLVSGCRKSMQRARHKIRAFAAKIRSGSMGWMDLWASVNAIMAYFRRYDDHNRILRLRRLFYSVFGFSCEDIRNFRRKEADTNGLHSAQAI